jgi:hypothetical protein
VRPTPLDLLRARFSAVTSAENFNLLPADALPVNKEMRAVTPTRLRAVLSKDVRLIRLSGHTINGNKRSGCVACVLIDTFCGGQLPLPFKIQYNSPGMSC